MKIFIDPGHNYSGADTGAQGNGLREQDITFGIAEKLKNLLINAGHSVKMSRNKLTENAGSTLSQSINTRAKLSNDWGADLFISIHCNAGGGTGTETLVYSLSGSAYNYAQKVQEIIVSRLKTTNRGVKERPDLGVLRLTNSPAILVETAFIDNANDSKLLREKQQYFAEAIYCGIIGEKTITEKDAKISELTDINDIIWEYSHRGLITDIEGMKKAMEKEPSGRLYWLARKTLHYMRSNDI